MKKLVILSILFFLTFSTFSQNEENKTMARVFVENNYQAGGQGLLVKWLARKVYYPEGINVYRKTDNSSWQKLNTSPIKLNLNASIQDLGNDKESKDFLTAIEKLSYQEFQESIFRAFVLIKNILNTDFALATGSLYHDKDAELGESYQYKIMAIEKGNEIEIAISDSHVTSAYQKQEAPKEFKAWLNFDSKSIQFKWLPEEYRYYGVLIYKSVNGGEFKSLNKTPIAIQKIKSDSGMVYPEVFYSDRSIGEDTAYSYKFVGIDFFGQETKYAELFDFPAMDFSFPAAPVNFNLKANNKEQTIQLSWDLDSISDDVIGLKVFRKSSGDSISEAVSDLLPIEARNYEESLSVTGGYYYYVATIDDGGNVSASNTIFIDMRDMKAPAVPQNFNIVADTGKFILSWDKVSDGDLAGYFIYRSLADDDNTDNKFMRMNSAPLKENQYEMEVSENVRNMFAYRLIATDTNFNNSDFSEIKVAQLPDVTPPATPLIKNVFGEDSVIIIDWLANVDLDLKGYNVLRRQNGDSADFKQINFNTLPKTSNRYSDKQAEKGIKYEYIVQALDENGLISERSNTFSGKIPKGVPNITPTNLNVRVNQKKKQVKISWEENEEEAESLIGYTVYRQNGKENARPIGGLLKNNEYIDKELKEGETYTYEVRAYSTLGDVLKSTQYQITINITQK